MVSEQLLLRTIRALSEGAGPGPLLETAQAHAGPGGHVQLVAGGRETWPATLHQHTDAVLALVRGAKRGPLRLQVGRQHVLVWPVGASAPYRLLMASRTGGEWSAQQIQDWAQIASLTSELLRTQELTVREDHARSAVMAARVSAFQHLMEEQTEAGLRTLEPLAPGLAAAGQGRIAVIAVAEGEDRDTAAREVEAALRTPEAGALTVLCPVEDREVIVLHAGGQASLEDLLAPLVQHPKGRAAGVSPLGAWHRTPALYDQAARSVDAARLTGDGVAVHDGTSALHEQLPAEARAWAHRLMAPLMQLPAHEREQLLHTCRLAVALGQSGAGRLTGLHRHTVAAQVERGMELLGLERTTPGHLVTAALALRLTQLPPPPPDTLPAAGISEVLDDDATRAWASGLLAKLPEELLATLTAWVRNEMNAKPTAAALGVSRNTVSSRLQRISGHLSIPLTHDRPGCWHDVMCALHATGRLPLTTLPQV